MSETLREQLEDAFDKYDDKPEKEPELEAEPAEPEEPAAEPEEEAPPETPEAEAPPEEEVQTEGLKPPAGWTPAQKEHWKTVPADIQKTILERDKHVDTTLQEAAEDRRVAQSYKEMVNTYAPVFAAEGVQDPMQGLQGLINITAQLQMGSQAQKAERIAGLIKHYGVDIQTLDNVLAGETVDPQMSQFEQMLDQRLAPVNQLLQRVDSVEQQNYNAAGEDIDAFAADSKNEFFDNVRETMADFMELANQQGRQMSLKEAYDKACAMNPEIVEIQASRRAEAAQQQSAADLEKKRLAASSISGTGVDTAADEGPLSLRETIARAMDKQGM